MKKMNLFKVARQMVRVTGMPVVTCQEILEKVISEITAPNFDSARTESYWKICTGLPTDLLHEIVG